MERGCAWGDGEREGKATAGANGKMREPLRFPINSKKNQCPGIFTAFLQKVRERTPRGLQDYSSITTCRREFLDDIVKTGGKNFAPDPSPARSRERSTRGLPTNLIQSYINYERYT